MLQILKYVGLAILGTGILLLMKQFAPDGNIQQGEYYYSSTLRAGYNMITPLLFIAIGVAVGYYTRLNPWLTGLALIISLPVAAAYEATVFRGSHNLIPFELVMYLVFSLPAIVGVYIGRLMFNRRVVKSR